MTDGPTSYRESTSRAHGMPSTDLALILDDLESYYRDVHANWNDSDEPLLLAVWTVHSYFIRAYEFYLNHTVYLNVVSREPNSGKTVLAHALANVVPGHGAVKSMTVAQLKRFLLSNPDHRVLILDQYHDFARARSTDIEVLNQYLTNGFQPGTEIDETLPNGQTVHYDPFFPKAFFGLTKYTPTPEVMSRSIQIMLRPSNERQERELWEKQKANPVNLHGASIKSAITAWVTGERAAQLDQMMNDLGKVIALNPGYGNLMRREADNWRMLFALADIASPDHGKRVRAIAARMTISHTTDASETEASEAEEFDKRILSLARTGRLPVDNWNTKAAYRGPVSDHEAVQIRAEQLGWPRDKRYGKKDKLSPVTIVSNDRALMAELRIALSDCEEFFAALRTSRSEFISAYRNAGRLKTRIKREKAIDTSYLPLYSGRKPVNLLAIDFAPVVYGKESE